MDEIREDAAGKEKLELLDEVSVPVMKIKLAEDQLELWILRSESNLDNRLENVYYTIMQ